MSYYRITPLLPHYLAAVIDIARDLPEPSLSRRRICVNASVFWMGLLTRTQSSRHEPQAQTFRYVPGATHDSTNRDVRLRTSLHYKYERERVKDSAWHCNSTAVIKKKRTYQINLHFQFMLGDLETKSGFKATLWGLGFLSHKATHIIRTGRTYTGIRKYPYINEGMHTYLQCYEINWENGQEVNEEHSKAVCWSENCI